MKKNFLPIPIIWLLLQVWSVLPARGSDNLNGSEDGVAFSIVDSVVEDVPLLDKPCSYEKQELANRAWNFGDEVWLINGRGSHYTDFVLGEPNVLRLEEQGFAPRDVQLLIDSHRLDSEKVTVMYIHGDRTDDFYACYRGVQVYQDLFLSNDCPRPPVRFVIWAWKSEKEKLQPSKDFRIKANRSRCVGKSLAGFLREFPDQRMLLAGYSLGGQIIFDALADPHIRQQSGCLSCPGFQVALIAPAFDGNFVSMKQRCFSEMLPVDHAEIFDNSRDQVLKFVRYHGRRTASGGGYPVRCLAADGKLGLPSLGYHDLAGMVGRKHAIYYYTGTPIVRQRVLEMVESLNGQIGTSSCQTN